MTDGILTLLGVFGVLCILTILRVGISVISETKLWQSVGWVWVTLSVGIYTEIRSPIGAGFDAVMLGLIHFAAMVI